jgi:hypothetical protein
MRKIVLLAAMLIAPGFAALPAEAGDRGPGFRNFPPHLGAPAHAFHPGHFRHFKPRHFGHHRHVRPRHFAHSGAFLKFHDGSFGFRLGTVPRFKHHVVPHVRPHHFVTPHHFRRHHHRPPVLTFARPSHLKPWGFSRHHHKSWRGRSHRHR